MRVFYTLRADEGFEFLTFHSKEAAHWLREEFRKGPLQKIWLPPKVSLVTSSDHGQPLAETDSPHLLPFARCFKYDAVKGLSLVLGKAGEFLPLDCPDCEVFIFHPVVRLEALDYEASDVIRFASGRIMTVRKYSFIPGIVEDVDVFVLSDYDVAVFFSERAVSLIREIVPFGLVFDKITGDK